MHTTFPLSMDSQTLFYSLSLEWNGFYLYLVFLLSKLSIGMDWKAWIMEQIMHLIRT